MTRERRWQSLGHGGATLWFTGPARRRQVDGRRRRRGAPARGRPARVPARRRQPAPRPQRRSRLRRDARTRERAAHRPRRAAARGVRARSRSSASSAPTRPIARPRRRCTRRTTSSSSRSSWTRRWSCASSATRRACTRARARASSPASPAWARPTRRPPTPTWCSAAVEETVEEEVERVHGAARRPGLIAQQAVQARPRARPSSSCSCLASRGVQQDARAVPGRQRPGRGLRRKRGSARCPGCSRRAETRECSWCPRLTTALNLVDEGRALFSSRISSSSPGFSSLAGLFGLPLLRLGPFRAGRRHAPPPRAGATVPYRRTSPFWPLERTFRITRTATCSGTIRSGSAVRRRRRP